MPSEKPARRLRDILENADAIARYTEGMDLGALTADAKTRDAVERCLERISEAARKPVMTRLFTFCERFAALRHPTYTTLAGAIRAAVCAPGSPADLRRVPEAANFCCEDRPLSGTLSAPRLGAILSWCPAWHLARRVLASLALAAAGPATLMG